MLPWQPRPQIRPVILDEQAGGGRTIIELIEAHASNARFAVVLLTPDDVDAAANDKDNLQSRARQNVIFEFGYFVGQLGRSRVCCLYKGEVVVPSDLDGLVYKKVEQSIDTQAYAIIRELKAAGYKINV